MSYDQVMEYLATYGLLFIFVVTFLEYLNFPGLPAGIVYPAAGIYAKIVDQSVIIYILVSVLAALAGSTILYALGYLGGDKFLNFLSAKFPKTYVKICEYKEKMIENEEKVLFISKLLPVVRTIISIPCGINKMKLAKHTLYTSLAVTIYNSSLILVGFFFGHVINFSLF